MARVTLLALLVIGGLIVACAVLALWPLLSAAYRLGGELLDEDERT